MPYSRPKLSELRQQIAADISASLPGSDPLLRFSNLFILGTAQAGLAHLHYGYLDWIAKQCNPYTAEGEFLEAWAALKGVYRQAAQTAKGEAFFIGLPQTILISGTPIIRSDGFSYTTLNNVTVSEKGECLVLIEANEAGQQGNTDTNTVLTLGTAIAGIQAAGKANQPIVGGASTESDDHFRTRMLAAYQKPPQGGSADDYVAWALSVPGITRAWCAPNGFGIGTVVVYIMLDDAQAAHQGFPQGTDGISQYDQGPKRQPRGVVATGDQLSVANAIHVAQPVTALVYIVSPLRHTIDFKITGIKELSPFLKKAIALAITDVFFRNGKPDGVIELSAIESEIAAIARTQGFVILSPKGNIESDIGYLPVLGEITYS